MDQPERELIHRARQGDGWAFEQLVSRYDHLILGLARDMVGDLADAQDVHQEALLAAYRGLSGFRQDSEFSTWLYRIAVNQALRFRRRRQRRRETDEESASESAPPAQERPDGHVLQAELARQLDRAMDGLSGQERAAFALCHRQGLRIDRAAELMECSPGSVKSYLFRGRYKVKKALEPYLEH